MKKYIYTLLTIFIASLGLSQTSFTLKSTTLGGQFLDEQSFNSFGCTGKNESPQLTWENAPKGTKSFAITMYDPDAPTGSGWWHWLVFNIPADTHELAKNAAIDGLPQGAIQSKTDFGNTTYGGPCPPEGHGYHQYIITVYALSVDTIELTKEANPALVGYYLNQNTLGKASIVAYYKRDKK